MTAKQFDKAVKSFPRLSDTGKTAARRVLLDGLAPVRVAEEMEVHRQQVHRWVKLIYDEHTANETKAM